MWLRGFGFTPIVRSETLVEFSFAAKELRVKES
jgi:hypothetical protein